MVCARIASSAKTSMSLSRISSRSSRGSQRTGILGWRGMGDRGHCQDDVEGCGHCGNSQGVRSLNGFHPLLDLEGGLDAEVLAIGVSGISESHDSIGIASHVLSVGFGTSILLGQLMNFILESIPSGVSRVHVEVLAMTF